MYDRGGSWPILGIETAAKPGGRVPGAEPPVHLNAGEPQNPAREW
jgi:hypothetical protein